MAEIIQNIMKKENYEDKIKDEKIVLKWKVEMEKQGGKKLYIDLAIDLIKKMKNNHSEINIYDHINWHLNLREGTVIANNIYKQCDCKCKICVGDECCSDEYDYEDDDESDNKSDNDNESENEDDDGNEMTKYSKECKCIGKIIKKKYISKNCFTNYDIENKFRIKLMEEIDKFALSKKVDYHPWSNNLVKDIVHPSLYCYVKGVTEPKINNNIIFSWLPAECKVSKKSASFTSYINNIPKNNDTKNLYHIIEKLLYSFIPNFQKVVDRLCNSTKLIDSNLQVIVKIAEINLTPSNTKYHGGTWHLEGITDENIVATGIYYYNMDNVTQSNLKFRTCVDEEIVYPQNCVQFVKTHYDMDDYEYDENERRGGIIIDSTMKLAQIKTKQGLSLVFPNNLQHCVSSFELKDKTKEGKRSIIAFFLIDPNKKILSTKDVTEQYDKISLKDAKIFREMLMFERKNEILFHNSVYKVGWSLCEH